MRQPDDQRRGGRERRATNEGRDEHSGSQDAQPRQRVRAQRHQQRPHQHQTRRRQRSHGGQTQQHHQPTNRRQGAPPHQRQGTRRHQQNAQTRHQQDTRTRHQQHGERAQQPGQDAPRESTDRRTSDRHWTSQPRGSGGRSTGQGDTNGYGHRGSGRYVGHGDAQGHGGGESAPDHAGQLSERTHGGRRSTPHHKREGTPREGSQRGNHSVQGVSGHVGGQFGDRLGQSGGWSEQRGYHAEKQFAGGGGESVRDRRYGSRHGHGSRRREDPRTR